MVAPSYVGWLSTKSGSFARQALNNPSSKPVRVTRFRYTAGMIWSVSTLLRRSGTARPVCVVKASISASALLRGGDGGQVGRGGQVTGDRGGGGDRRRHEVGAPALALTAL